jgi:hypothetical protein
MTGDDLITLVTEAGFELEARAIARKAPGSALHQAADLLFIDDYGMSRNILATAVVREARA